MKGGDNINIIPYNSKFKKSFIIILVFFLAVSLYIPEKTHSASISITIGPNRQYRDLASALGVIDDGGTIFVDYSSTPYAFSTLTIDKNVNIEGKPNANGDLPSFSSPLSSKDVPLLIVKSPDFFTIKNIYFASVSDKVFVESHTPNLSVDKVSTRSSIPLVIKSPLNGTSINATITNSSFSIKAPKVLFNNAVEGSVLFENNTFNGCGVFFLNNGVDISVYNNMFIDGSINTEEFSIGDIEVSSNEFKGTRAAITSYSSKDLTISNNSYLATKIILQNKDTNNILDLRYNWWGSFNGPTERGSINFIASGNVDYSNWALDNSFSEFYGCLSLQGRVKLKNSFNHSDVKITLSDSETLVNSTFSDNNGYFNLNNLEPKVFTLTYEYNGYTTVSEEVYLVAGSIDDVYMEMEYGIGLFDFDEDGLINDMDLNLLLNSYGTTSLNNAYDINRDNEINILDLIIFHRFRGKGE